MLRLLNIFGNRFFEERDFGSISKLKDDELDKEIENFKFPGDEDEQEPDKSDEKPEEIKDENKEELEKETDKEDEDTPDPDDSPDDKEDSPDKDTEDSLEKDTEDPEKPDTVTNILDQQLTDELISKLPAEKFSPDDKKYLEKYIGKDLGTALISLANSQKVIGKRAEGLYKQPEKPSEEPANKPVVAKSEEAEIAKLKSELVVQQLKTKYPDMPTDPEERKAWERNLNYEDPDAYYTYREERINAGKGVDNYVDQSIYYRDNYVDMNDKTIDGEIQAINEFVKNVGLNLKDLGVDLTKDANGDNEFIESILFTEDGKFNPDVVEIKYNKPIIKKGEIKKAFRDRYDDKIVEAIRKQARLEGANGGKKKPEQFNPKGVITKEPRIKRDLISADISKLTDADLDKAIENFKLE